MSLTTLCIDSMPQYASSKELHRKPNQKTKHRKIKSVNHPPDAIGAVKIFP